MGPLDKFMLAEDSLKSTDTGFDLKAYSHWYRSLPVSSIGTLQLKIDGVKLDSGNFSIELEGKLFDVNQLRNYIKYGGSYWIRLSCIFKTTS